MQALHHRSGMRFLAGDDQGPGHVVDAVAVLDPLRGQPRVLEQATLVGQRLQVVEDRPDPVGRINGGRRAGVHRPHAATTPAWAISRSARKRYCLATADHRRSGAAPRRPGHARGQLRAGDHPAQTLGDGDRVAVRDHDAGAPREQLDGVREPAATTGLPAATASMSTPEVTCSVES